MGKHTRLAMRLLLLLIAVGNVSFENMQNTGERE
jgi:hypothetical protein